MEQKLPTRLEVLMAGLGGGGILLIGRLLAQATLPRYKYVSWVPSFAIAKRGGACECTVISSDKEIASPLLPKAQAVLILDSSQLKAFEGRVRPGGIIVIESAGLQDEVERKDIEVLKVPALEKAVEMGETLASNLIMLGAYVGATKTIPAELIEKELEQRFGDKESVLSLNLKAFREGLKMGTQGVVGAR